MGKALLMLMNEREQYFAIVNGEKRAISLTEYLRYKDSLEEDYLLISAIEGPIFFKRGEWQSKSLTSSYSKLTHIILLEAYQYGETSVHHIQDVVEGRYTESTIERNIRRINEYMTSEGEERLPIYSLERINRESTKIKLIPKNYIYVYREYDTFDFTPLNIDEE